MAFGIRSERTRLWALPFDARTGRVTGAGEPVSPDGADATFPDVSADGLRIAFRLARPGNESLWERTRAAGERVLVSAEPDELFGMPRWSRDGTRLAFMRGRRGPSLPAFRDRWTAITEMAGGSTAVYTEGGGVAPVPPPFGSDLMVVNDWSRDGAQLLSSCGQWAIGLGLCLSPAPGGASPSRQPVPQPGEPASPKPSPRPSPQPGPRRLTAKAGTNLYQGHFSPDDRWVLFTAIATADPGVARIYAMASEGGPWIPITDGRAFDDKPRWSADATMIYFVSNRSGFLNVWRQRFDPVAGRPVGEAVRLTHFETPGQMILPSIRRNGAGGHARPSPRAADRSVWPDLDPRSGPPLERAAHGFLARSGGNVRISDLFNIFHRVAKTLLATGRRLRAGSGSRAGGALGAPHGGQCRQGQRPVTAEGSSGRKPMIVRVLRRYTTAVVLACLVSVTHAAAQGSTADIVGRVTDSGGGALPGTTATVTHVATGTVRTLVTNESGDFVANALPIGAYSVRIELEGFKAYASTVNLSAGDRVRLDAVLEVGALTETVQVEGSTPVLQTDSSAVQEVVMAKAVQDLPLNGRNYVNLVQMAAGANPGPPNGLSSGNRPDDRRQSSTVSVNGQSTSTTTT